MRTPDAARLTFALLTLAVAALPALAQPSAYAQQWPVQADTPGAYAINLTPALYQLIQRSDLGDMIWLPSTAAASNSPSVRWHRC